MSNFTNLNEVFHIFSKTPVADGQTLASARNKSGHTVTVNDVWAEDIHNCQCGLRFFLHPNWSQAYMQSCCGFLQA